MSLRDEMLKAGLITEDEAKRVAHKQRQDKKRTDPKERQRQQETRRREAQQQKEAERKRHREQSQRANAEQASREQAQAKRQREETALQAAYREGLVPNWEGGRRYYYAANGRVDWLMVSDDAARKLEGGQAAICAGERNVLRPVVLNAAAARKLAELAPERVLTWHRP